MQWAPDRIREYRTHSVGPPPPYNPVVVVVADEMMNLLEAEGSMKGMDSHPSGEVLKGELSHTPFRVYLYSRLF